MTGDRSTDLDIVFFEGKFHPHFNLPCLEDASWNGEANLRAYFSEVVTPEDLLGYARLRREFSIESLGLTKVPVDLIFWSQAIRSDLALTRFGGLPYRRAGLSWPEAKNRPLYFLAQFNFQDSEFMRDLPGDLMRVFVTDDLQDFIVEWDWVSELEYGAICNAAPIPNPRFPELSGIMCRFEDYLVAPVDNERVLAELKKIHAFAAECLISTRCTKIGVSHFRGDGHGDECGVAPYVTCYSGGAWPTELGLRFPLPGDPGHFLIGTAYDGSWQGYHYLD